MLYSSCSPAESGDGRAEGAAGAEGPDAGPRGGGGGQGGLLKRRPVGDGSGAGAGGGRVPG